MATADTPCRYYKKAHVLTALGGLLLFEYGQPAIRRVHNTQRW
jgi:hypothetical protein